MSPTQAGQVSTFQVAWQREVPSDLNNTCRYTEYNRFKSLGSEKSFRTVVVPQHNPAVVVFQVAWQREVPSDGWILICLRPT